MYKSGSCGAKPIAKIIKVGDTEAGIGIIGLENALRNVYLSTIKDDEHLQQEPLAWVKEFGNYITPTREEVDKQALLRDYKKYCQALAEEAQAQARADASPPKKRWLKLF